MKYLRIIGLFCGHMSMTVLGSIAFKLSAGSSDWRGFWFWQILGNLET